jgi:hypothetical protein
VAQVAVAVAVAIGRRDRDLPCLHNFKPKMRVCGASIVFAQGRGKCPMFSFCLFFIFL